MYVSLMSGTQFSRKRSANQLSSTAGPVRVIDLLTYARYLRFPCCSASRERLELGFVWGFGSTDMYVYHHGLSWLFSVR